MELQWNSTPWEYLKCNVRQVQNQEQTMELRISDGMPDIGRVICAWGQPVLRSKEWRSDGMSIAGGVSVWVLYEPEDGTVPQSVQAWLPFQGKWSFADSHREGVIHADILLRSVDARTLSARKLMVRANVGMLGCAMEPEKVEVFEPEELPEQVFGLQKTYPVTIEAEAGERLLNLEDTFSLPQNVRRILACQVRPVLSEQIAAGSRVVFRGAAYVDTLFLDEAENLAKQTFEMPFAQFGDLNAEYDKDATASVSVAVSNLESELTEGGIHIKCGLVAQYTIRRQRLLQVMEDAYSPLRKVEPKWQQLCLPTVLESYTEYIVPSEDFQLPYTRLLCGQFLPDHPTLYREGSTMMLEVPGTFGLLAADTEGRLQWQMEPWSDGVSFPVAEPGRVHVSLSQMQGTEVRDTPEGAQVGSRLRMDITTMAPLQISMICGLQIGDPIQQNPSRPSLLLQRMGQTPLWDMAKDAGSTVEVIWKANDLQEEPVPGQILLIPVL